MSSFPQSYRFPQATHDRHLSIALHRTRLLAKLKQLRFEDGAELWSFGRTSGAASVLSNPSFQSTGSFVPWRWHLARQDWHGGPAARLREFEHGAALFGFCHWLRTSFDDDL
jgi:hypothetical protein